MTRRFAALVALSLVLTISPVSQASEFFEIKFLVINSDGSPSRGQIVRTATWGERLTDANGMAEFALPAGERRFDFEFWPDSDIENVASVSVQTNIQVTGDKSYEIRLPAVIDTAMRIEDSVGRPLTLANGLRLSGLCTQSFKPGIGEQEMSSTRASPIFVFRNSDGRRVPQNFGLFGGGFLSSPLRGEEGLLRVAFFMRNPRADQPCDTSSPFSRNAIFLGVEPSDTAEFSDEELLSGQVTARSSSALFAQAQIVPSSVRNSGTNIAFKLEGQVLASSPQYLELVKSIHVVGVPRGVSGNTTKISNGSFGLQVNVNLAQAQPSLLFLTATLADGSRRGLGFVDLPKQPGPLSVRAWTKDVGNNKMNIYVRELIGAGKIRLLHNGKEVAWVRAEANNDPKLRQSAFGPYLVRTLAIQPGRNVFEIFVDSSRIVRRITNR